MDRVVGGNHDAFQVLVHRHADRAYRLARRIVANQADAEDVTQDAFLRIWARAHRWSVGEGRFSPWLARIVTNLCIDRIRSRTESVELPESVVDCDADPVAGLHWQQVGQRIAEEAARLPVRQRLVLVLCLYEGYSHAEAAVILGASIGAVESLLVRARRTLERRLAAYFES